MAVYGNTVEGQVLSVYNHRGKLLWDFRARKPADEGSRGIMTGRTDRVVAGFQSPEGNRLLGFSRGAQPDWQAPVEGVPS